MLYCCTDFQMFFFFWSKLNLFMYRFQFRFIFAENCFDCLCMCESECYWHPNKISKTQLNRNLIFISVWRRWCPHTARLQMRFQAINRDNWQTKQTQRSSFNRIKFRFKKGKLLKERHFMWCACIVENFIVNLRNILPYTVVFFLLIHFCLFPRIPFFYSSVDYFTLFFYNKFHVNFSVFFCINLFNMMCSLFRWLLLVNSIQIEFSIKINCLKRKKTYTIAFRNSIVLCDESETEKEKMKRLSGLAFASSLCGALF